MSVQRMGGVAAVSMGLCGAVFVGCTLIASPTAYDPGGEIWPYVVSDYALALMGLFGLAVIPAISESVMHLNPGWMRWMNSLALLGCALLAVLNFWQAEYEMISEDPSYTVPIVSGQAASFSLRGDVHLLVEEFVARTPRGWIEAAGIGLWAVSVCWLALKGGVLSAGLAGTGLAGGFLSIFAAAGAAFDTFPLQVLGVVGLVVVLPVWLMWMGFSMLEGSSLAAQPVAGAPAVQIDPHLLRDPVRRSDRKRPLIRLWPS